MGIAEGAQRRGVETDAGPARADKLANVTMAVPGRVAEHLLVVLGEQARGVGLAQITVLTQAEDPAGAGVLAGLVAKRAVAETGWAEFKVLIDQFQGVVEIGMTGLY